MPWVGRGLRSHPRIALGREATALASLYLIKLSGEGESWVRMEWIRRRTLVGESGRPGDVDPTCRPKDDDAASSLPDADKSE